MFLTYIIRKILDVFSDKRWTRLSPPPQNTGRISVLTGAAHSWNMPEMPRNLNLWGKCVVLKGFCTEMRIYRFLLRKCLIIGFCYEMPVFKGFVRFCLKFDLICPKSL